MQKVVVVGLGRLGSPMAAVLAASGRRVTGIDLDERAVQAINSGKAPVVEPGLDELLSEVGRNLTASSDYSAVSGSDITFVVVPTPSDVDGEFRLDYVLDATACIGSALKEATKRHVVVITSTVMPGSTMGPIREALESSSGLKVGQDVGLCYSPEFIALGTVIRDLTKPDMILTGESDAESGTVLLETLRSITGPETPVARMDPTSAEVAKLAVNTFVTTKISYANMLAEICEQLPGADVQRVTTAVGLDSRIGPKYLMAGAPYGGPCFPRDNAALAALARRLGVGADIAEATDLINRRQVDRVLDLLERHRDLGTRLAILGLSYKAGTPVRDESFGVALAERCVGRGFSVVAWDPMCRLGRMPTQLEAVHITDSLTQAISTSDLMVIATQWPELSELSSLLRGASGPSLVIDCWRTLGDSTFDDGFAVIQLGRSDTLGPMRPGIAETLSRSTTGRAASQI